MITRPCYLDRLKKEVSRLLTENAELLKGFKTMCRDCHKLYQRLKVLGSVGSGLPVKAHCQQENDRNAVNLMGGGGGHLGVDRRYWTGSGITAGRKPTKTISGSLGQQPIANLEKMSADLQEIARKLENLKS